MALVESTTKLAYRFMKPISATEFLPKLAVSWTPRKGPVFLEIPLDVQAATVERESLPPVMAPALSTIREAELQRVVELYDKAERPILLVGGGVSYATAERLRETMLAKRIPTMTTYNGADRFDGDDPIYLGRPNTWGQRSSNIIIQQSDLIIAVGTRLGMQQTGFNWQEFGREATVVQIEIDEGELNKGHPVVDHGYAADADDFLARFVGENLPRKTAGSAARPKNPGRDSPRRERQQHRRRLHLSL